MSRVITVYCEGKSGSHDYDLLDKVLRGLFVKIEPIGSKRGAAALINFLENEGKIDRSDYYFFFRDRDLDKDLRTDYQNGSLSIELKKNNTREVGCFCFSLRTTIENYLIHPESLFEFLRQKNIAARYGITNAEDMRQTLTQAAQDIRYYQAARHALGAMRENPGFETSWTGSSGKLPAALDEQSCIAESEKLLQKIATVTRQWNAENFRQRFEEFKALFDENFFNEMQFLVWFQGKDLAAALCTHLPSFPLNDYYKFAKATFDYKAYNDLVTFRGLVESKLKPDKQVP